MHLLNTHFRCIAIQAPASSAEQSLQNIFFCMKNALNLNSFQSHCLLSEISECKYDHIYVKMPKLGMLSHTEQQTGNSTDPHILPLPGSWCSSPREQGLNTAS